MPNPSDSLLAFECLLDRSPVFRELRDREEWRNVRGWYMANQLKVIELKKTAAEMLREHAEMLEKIDELLRKTNEPANQGEAAGYERADIAARGATGAGQATGGEDVGTR